MPTKVKKDETLEVIKKKFSSVFLYVKRDSLKPAPWNPPIRVQLRYMTPLRRSMEAHGFWDFAPIIVAEDGTIIDGHRRWVCAGLLHIEEIPVVMVDAPPEEVWAEYNSTRASMTGAQMLQARAGGLSHVPATDRNMLGNLEDLVGYSGIRRLAELSVSPHVYHEARRIAKYVNRPDDNDFLKKTVFWLAENRRMNSMAIRLMRDNGDATALLIAIEGNRPLESKWV